MWVAMILDSGTWLFLLDYFLGMFGRKDEKE